MALFYNYPEKTDFSERFCGILLDFVLAGGVKKNIVLPTDSTSEQGCRMAAKVGELRNAFRFQQLDEYVGTSTFQNMLSERLLDNLEIEERSLFEVEPPFNHAEALAKECARMEGHLQMAGKIDGAFLGVGKEDVHFGMHFPGVSFDTGVHVVDVPEWMQAHNATYNGVGKTSVKTSDKGITLGAANFRDTGLVVVMGGPEKVGGLKKAFFEGMTTDVPLSFLQSHRERLGDNLIVLTWGPGYEGWKPDLTI